MAPLGREAANEKAGVEIPSHLPQNNSPPKSPHLNLIPRNQKVVAPVFNVVSGVFFFQIWLLNADGLLQTDDANSTLLSVGQVVTSVFGTTFEFFNFVESTIMKVCQLAMNLSLQSYPCP